MECGKFIVSGEDKRSLTIIKNNLVNNGHVFIGYLKEPSKLLRYIKTNNPELVIVEICGSFTEVKRVLEIIDEEILSACVLLLDSRNEDIIDFIRNSRLCLIYPNPYLTKLYLKLSICAC
jgi:response regulator NasT